MSVKLKDVIQKSVEFRPLFNRFDADMDLGLLEAFKFLDFTTKRPIPKIINMTLNDPAVFAMKCTAVLQSAMPTLAVESESLTDEQMTNIEHWSDDLFITADEDISVAGLFGLYPFSVEQTVYRGRVGAFSLCRMVNGKKVIDVRPTDMRYVIYEMGMDGFNYVCFISNHSRSYLIDKYGSVAEQRLGSKMNAITMDVYDREDNDFYISGNISDNEIPLKSQKHGFVDENGKGYVPFVMEKVPTGSMLQHPRALVADGESIFFLNRGLYPEMNRLATTLHNLTLASFFGARQYASKLGEKKKTKALPFGLGVVVSIDIDGGYTLIPVNDIRNATRLEYSMMESRLQRGSLPNIDYGNLTFPLSAVAIGKLTEAKDHIFIPRLQCLAKFKQSLTKMVRKQLVQMGGSIELGEEGHRTVYPVASLKGEYVLKYKYFAESREQRLANITEAQSLRGLLPDDVLRKETLSRKHPEEDLAQLRDERAEATDPAIMYYRRTEALIQKESYLEAEMSLRSLEILLRQREVQKQLSLNPPVQGAGGGQQEAAMPLLGRGEGGGGERAGKGEEERMAEQENEGDRVGRLAETGREGRVAQR